MQTLFLAMALYPEVQKKAQAEIDAVVGTSRLPDFHDRPSLPYINAVLKELSRWNLVGPLGRFFQVVIVIISASWRVLKLFPTCLLSTTNIMVFIFRRGQLWWVMHGWLYDHVILFSVLNFLFRSILHDSKAFNDPHEFQPERYLKDGKINPDVRDPECAAFGFGRRSVNTSSTTYYFLSNTPLPQYMSWKIPERQLVILNCILSSRGIWYQTTNWRPGKYPQAQTWVHQRIIDVNMLFSIKYASNWLLRLLWLDRYPVPFKCIIKPRTPAAEALIRDSVNEES